jgi:hypothetical protein
LVRGLGGGCRSLEGGPESLGLVGALVEDAVDEESRGTADARGETRDHVAIDASGMDALDELAGDALGVEQEVLGVAP